MKLLKTLAASLGLLLALGPGLDAKPRASEEPAWLGQALAQEGEHFSIVGHSGPQPDEAHAKDEALADALKQFVAYCKTDVDSVDRIYETYSAEGGKTRGATNMEFHSQLRVKAFVRRALPEDWFIRREKGSTFASVLLKVPREEYDRISREKSAKLSVDVGFFHEDASKKLRPLGEGDVLKSGDGYALFLRPSDTCFLYVYQLDALGKSFRLFPNPGFKTAGNPVPAGMELWVPNQDDILFLDETTGKERFYIFGSPESLPEFEGEKAASLTRKDLDAVMGFKKMGVAGMRQKLDASKVAPPTKTDVVEIKKKLQAEGAFVYETWFWHR
jgi:hypothetical protein